MDVGSFVSPIAIPQMQDTAAVLAGLDRSESDTQLLTIVANERGAKDACAQKEVDWLGYPFSISENFQMRNTHKTIEASQALLDRLLDLSIQNSKDLVVYLSMGFGNPYGDPWSPEIVAQWIDVLASKGIKTISLSDTVERLPSQTIGQLFSFIIPQFPKLLLGPICM